MSKPEKIESKYIKQLIVRADNMSASIVVSQPPRSEVNNVKKEIIDLLGHRGICYGVLEQSIELLFDQKLFGHEVEVARGISVVLGSDGKLLRTIHLQKEKEVGANLDPNLVVEGDALFEVIAPTQGSHGINVFGKVSFATPGKIPEIAYGTGVSLTDDGTKIIATRAGYLEYDETSVDVVDTFVVDGSVNRFTGNIHFPGNVYVKGDVAEGYIISADGDVIIDGLVDSATIIAEKSITIKKGLIGGNRAMISAKEDIFADFIENTLSVESGKSIYASLILNSNLYAMDSIIVENDGQIIGGRCVAHNRIECKIAGFKSYVHTELVVGVAPERLAQIEETESLIIQLRASNDEVRKNIVFLEGKLSKPALVDDVQNEVREDLREYMLTFGYNNGVLVELNERLLLLKATVNDVAKILVSNVIYPLTRVKVNHMELLIQEHMNHRCIFSDEEEILIIDMDDCVG